MLLALYNPSPLFLTCETRGKIKRVSNMRIALPGVTKHSYCRTSTPVFFFSGFEVAMPLPLPFKCMLFLGLWHEVAAQFRMGADSAFVVALLVFYGGWFVQRFTLEFAGMSAELTAALIVHGTLWLLLYCWLAPDMLRAQPWSFILVALVALVLAGLRLREHFDLFGYASEKAYLRDHSEATVGLALGGLGAACLARHHWGSVLPLIGYVALVGLPLSFGWMGGAHVNPRYDAQFGDENMFHDAGVSEDH
jgi:hypothetical protein